MSENYLPLFRKYRPQAFCDLVGQESLVKALSNAIELNRIVHAYLFCGPRGTGKTSSARIFAKSLNCEHGPTLNPCQKCASCIDITNATGMDVIEIDAAANRGVEDAEDLIEQVHYAPINGKYKIFIIDEVHMLSTAAFNALLKTFEEPPENVVFILATTEAQKVPETIISRCQRFDFKRITVDDIVKRLREISEIEKIKITDDALFNIAKNVSGGMRDSLALLDQVSILGAREEITKDMIDELLGKVTFDKLINLLDKILLHDVENALTLVDEIYSKGSEPRNLCENFMEFLKNIIIILNSKNPHDVTKFCSLSTVDIDTIVKKNYDPKKCSRILDIAIEYYKEVKFATNPYLWVELLIIQAAKTQDIQQNISVQVQQIKPVEQKIVKEEIKPIQKEEKEVQAQIQEPPQNIKEESKVQEPPQQIQSSDGLNPVDIWSKIVNSIESVPAKFFYSGMAKLVEIDENRIVLGFINHNVITQAKSDLKHKALIEGEKKAFGGVYSFEFVQLGGDIKPLEGAAVKPIVKSQPPKEIKKEVKETTLQQEQNIQEEKPKENLNEAFYSPKVKEMLEAFSGKIID